MAKNLILLWGFNRNETAYKKVVDMAPVDWRIYQFPYTKLTPNGKPIELHASLSLFLKEKGLKKVYLMGHSLGGSLALDFAIHNQNLVEKLFLVDSAGVYSRESVVRAFYNIVRYGSHPINELGKTIYGFLRTMRNPVLHFKLGLHAHYVDLLEQAKNLKVPTIIFWGANDKITPLWQGERLNKVIFNSKLIIFKDKGHDWIIYHPEIFWDNI